MRALLEEHERFIGKPQRELEARLREPLPCESPPRKLTLAIQVLARSDFVERPVSKKTSEWMYVFKPRVGGVSFT